MRDSILLWSRSFLPQRTAVDRFERMRACAGALFGILIAGLLSYLLLPAGYNSVWLIAPMGASAVLLFAVPASPLAQPWSIIGGNLVAATIGVACAQMVDAPMLAAALAIALAIGAMFALRCIHPPSGAVALTAVLGGPAVHAMGFSFVLAPVAVNSFLLLFAALFFNNATGRRYPHAQQTEHRNPHHTQDSLPIERLGFTHEDLDIVLQRYNQVLDISRDDLEEIFLQTEMLAYRRRFGETVCGDIMSGDIVAVEFATELEDAWQLMQQHKLKAMPVLDRARRVIGIITRTDFLSHAVPPNYGGLRQALQALLQRAHHTYSAKPEVVGQIMSVNVKTVARDLPIVQLVGLMTDGGVHQVPVIDDDRRLVGMVSRSDMIAALYESNLGQTSHRENGSPAG